MTLLASKCVDGAAQRALSLAKCVNKVAQWGFRWLKSLLAGCGSSHHSALLKLRRLGGGEWQIRFGGIWCWLDRGNQEIPLDGWLPLTYATNTSLATNMARGGNIFQLGDQRSEDFDQRLMDSGGRLSIAVAIFLRVVNLQQNWLNWVCYAGSDFLFFADPFLSISHLFGKMLYYHHYQKEWFVIYSLDDCMYVHLPVFIRKKGVFVSCAPLKLLQKSTNNLI